ncbi:phytanoyl-CoA dioxygenase family protein [Paenibacillus mendelii]|uniref:Phytanoyl-CoA dioxygenase family protein n=1 Tax=Paenibacillus mendelii TaxID=206163 RepID=A0ABV6JAQ6_9BACL|nr:phytanoyl-CoA dioxygenase family protein [Paenibacillus mendelii]MCQ6560722.1 phytanoyl-CoA dioxygenase family protein [Paenibacillus mendelii]
MRLTAAQIDFFETFGFIKFPQLLADSIDWITDEFTKTFPDYEGIKPHDGSQRTCIARFIDQREKMNTLLDDPRIKAIGQSLVGDNFNYMGSDGNYYSGETGWHRDGFHHKYRHIKVAFYLDQLDGNSGALRVIPGSHRLDDQYGKDLTEKMRKSSELWGIAGSQVPAISLDVTPGDLLVFDHNTFHAAFNGGPNRRMFTMNLCERYQDEDLQELRDYISGAARFWIDRSYTDTMMNTASPSRMVHLEQVMANDGHLAELSAKMRETMPEPARG